MFENHIAGKPIGHQDIGGAGVDIAPLYIADEIEAASCQQGVRRLRQLTSLVGLSPVVNKSYSGRPDAQGKLSVSGTHYRRLQQVLGAGLSVGPHIQQETGSLQTGQHGSQHRPPDPANPSND